MKSTGILILSMAFLFACSSKNGLEQKKEELKNAKAELAKVSKKVKDIEKEIAKLDTSSKEDLTGTVVEVTTLERKRFVHNVKVHGVVEASKNILANPEVSGRITSIEVKEGQKVNTGQVIARVDASILLRNMDEVKKGLEFATTMYEKQKALNEKGIGTEVQFLEAKNRKESLEKSLSTLQSQLEKYVVKAPISGYIDDVMPKVGEMINPQMPIARIVNLDKVFVEAEISEALLGKVKEQDEVGVNFTSLGKSVSGRIVQTSQYINPQNRTFKIKIDLKEQNSLFKPNLLAVVKIDDYKADSAVVVPTTTVQDDLKGDFVFVKKGGKAAKKYVEVGISNDSETQILSGLEAGEIIITKGQKGLVEGEELRVVKS